MSQESKFGYVGKRGAEERHQEAIHRGEAPALDAMTVRVYRSIQVEINKLKGELDLIGPRMMPGKPGREAAIELGAAITKKIEELEEEKKRLEGIIKDAGESPGSFTVQ